MYALTDPEDHAVMLSDMTRVKNTLQRDLHMEEMKRFKKKHQGLRTVATNKRNIEILNEQLEDVNTEVKNVYSKKNARQDAECQGYIIYLLDIQDYYRKCVEHANEHLREAEKEFHICQSKLSQRRRKYAVKVKSKARLTPKQILVALFEDRIEKLMHDMGKLATKNRVYRDNLNHLFMMRRNFFRLHQRLVEEKKKTKAVLSGKLQQAVVNYKTREDYIHKTGVFNEKCAVDRQKVTANNILLHRMKERDVQADEFEKQKVCERQDCRAGQFEELVRKGLTGLEPELAEAEDTHTRVMKASGVDNVEEIHENFEKSEAETYGHFCYVQTISTEIDQMNSEIATLMAVNNKLEKHLTVEQRQYLMEVKKHEAVEKQYEKDLVKSEKVRNRAHQDLDKMKTVIKDILVKEPFHQEEINFNDTTMTEEEQITEWLGIMEKKLTTMVVMCEYLSYKEGGLDVVEEEKGEVKEEVKEEVGEGEDEEKKEEDEEEKEAKVKDSELTHAPRTLEDEETKAVQKLVSGDGFLTLEELLIKVHDIEEHLEDEEVEDAEEQGGGGGEDEEVEDAEEQGRGGGENEEEEDDDDDST